MGWKRKLKMEVFKKRFRFIFFAIPFIFYAQDFKSFEEIKETFENYLKRYPELFSDEENRRETEYILSHIFFSEEPFYNILENEYKMEKFNDTTVDLERANPVFFELIGLSQCKYLFVGKVLDRYTQGPGEYEYLCHGEVHIVLVKDVINGDLNPGDTIDFRCMGGKNAAIRYGGPPWMRIDAFKRIFLPNALVLFYTTYDMKPEKKFAHLKYPVLLSPYSYLIISGKSLKGEDPSFKEDKLYIYGAHSFIELDEAIMRIKEIRRRVEEIKDVWVKKVKKGDIEKMGEVVIDKVLRKINVDVRETVPSDCALLEIYDMIIKKIKEE